MKITASFLGAFSILTLCVATSLTAAEISLSIDGNSPSRSIDCEWVQISQEYGIWVVDPFDWTDSEGNQITISGELDPDPQINFAINVLDFGAPSNFSFTFILPLNPLVSNPSIVFDSLVGTVTGGAGGGGVTVTALPPPPGIPVDGDPVVELQVYTLSDDGGLTWKNVGLDAGPTTFVPVAPFFSAPYGSYNQGPIPTIAGGPWTHMRADLNFGLSGGGDAFSLSGAKVLVPEPATGALALLFAMGMSAIARRSR